MAGGGSVVVVGGGGGTPGGSNGQIQYNNSGAFGGIALGANNTVLTSNGSSASFAAPSGGGSLVLVEQHSASSSATLDFTTGLTSTYDTYLFVMSNIIPQTNTTTLTMRVSTDGGSTFITANYNWARWFWQTGGNSVGGSASDSSISLSAALGNAAPNNYNGQFYLFNPLQATTYTFIDGQSAFYDGSALGGWVFCGKYSVAASVNAVRFLMASGNITSGTIRLYGVAKS